MKHNAVAIMFIIFILTVSAGCRPVDRPASLTDDMGRNISLTSTPQRIISHVPSITEMLYALGLGEKIVGVDDYSNYPPEAKNKPRVGNYWEPSIEIIISLNPDIVLTDGHSENIKQLDSLGIQYVVIDPKNIDGIFKDLDLIGKIAGKEKEAGRLVDSMKSQISTVLTEVKNVPPVSVFYVLDARTDLNNPWTAGPGSFIDSLITMAGGENIAAAANSAYAQFSIEAVIAADPQVIILPFNTGTDVTESDLKASPIWSNLTAVKKSRIFSFNADLANPVPRITQGLEDMTRIIHPELFQ
jgi:iron complex transport system substrate-binding protein